MTMPIGPDFIALQVRDLAASAQFYKDVFGFEPENRSPPGAVVLKTQPIALALLWVACDDADKLHDLIIARGGAILSPPVDGPFGRFFVARDPDGYAITFHTSRKA